MNFAEILNPFMLKYAEILNPLTLKYAEILNRKLIRTARSSGSRHRPSSAIKVANLLCLDKKERSFFVLCSTFCNFASKMREYAS